MFNTLFFRHGRNIKSSGLDYPAHIIFFAFSIIGLMIAYGGFVYFNQESTRNLLHDQVVYSLEKTEIMLQKIVDIELKYFENNIKNMANNSALRDAFVAGDQQEFLNSYYDWNLNKYDNALDLVVYSSVGRTSDKCMKITSLSIKDFDNLCALINDISDSKKNYRWTLQTYSSSEGNRYMLIFSQILIDPNGGEIIGKVTGGISLTANSKFLERIQTQSEGGVDALAFAVEDKNISESENSTDIYHLYYQAEQGLINYDYKKGDGFDSFSIIGEFVYQKHKLQLSDQESDLYMLIVLKNNPFIEMEQEWHSNFFAKTIWFLVVAIFVAWLSANKLKKELKLLLNYSRYASRRGDDQSPNFSAIREVKAIGHAVASMMDTIKDSEQRMQAVCHDLEQTVEEKRALLRRVVETQEREGANLSSVLYEKINRPLSTISQKALMIKVQVGKNKKASDAAADIKKISDNMFKDIGREINDLKPLDSSTGLLNAIPKLPILRNLEQRDVDVHINTVKALPVRSEKIEVSLYRIIQEALLNVLEHSQANILNIDIWIQEKSVHLLIRDNGISIRKPMGLEMTPNEEGRGVTCMREHAESLGGTFLITMDDAGCMVKVVIPFIETISKSISEASTDSLKN